METLVATVLPPCRWVSGFRKALDVSQKPLNTKVCVGAGALRVLIRRMFPKVALLEVMENVSSAS